MHFIINLRGIIGFVVEVVVVVVVLKTLHLHNNHEHKKMQKCKIMEDHLVSIRAKQRVANSFVIVLLVFKF